MLVLTRRAGQSIIIGDDVKVEVIEVSNLPDGSVAVSLGVTAPRHICVDRQEVRIKRLQNVKSMFSE